MSFDIGKTPTLHAVATQDERLLTQDLHQRVEEAVRQAETQADVAEAVRAQRTAEKHREGLRTAERTLTMSAQSLRELLAELAKIALEALIQSAISKGQPSFAKLEDLGAKENESRFVNRAIERLVEHLIPSAEIVCLREESHALMSTARAVERAAQQRAEKVLGHLRDAVSEEVVLPVDLSKGVAGALIAHADGLKRRATQLAESADRLENEYRERCEANPS